MEACIVPSGIMVVLREETLASSLGSVSRVHTVLTNRDIPSTFMPINAAEAFNKNPKWLHDKCLGEFRERGNIPQLNTSYK